VPVAGGKRDAQLAGDPRGLVGVVAGERRDASPALRKAGTWTRAPPASMMPMCRAFFLLL
jgi:hypothetical protein